MTSSIGAASPLAATAAAGSANQGQDANTAGVDPSNAANQSTPSAQPSGSAASSGGLAGSLRWLGPLLAVAGGIALVKGVHSGALADAAKAVGHDVLGVAAAGSHSKALVYGGAGAALAGLGLTGVGFATHGKQLGLQQGITVGATAQEQQDEKVIQEFEQKMEAQVASGSAGTAADPGGPTSAAGVGANPGAAGAAGAGTDPGAATPATGAQPPSLPGMPAVGGSGATTGAGTGATNSLPSASTPGTATPGTTASGTASAAGAWTAAGLLNHDVTLQGAAMSSGSSVADAGSFALTSVLGDANGYSSAAAADAVAKGSVAEVSSTKDARWLVLNHGGRYYAYSATLDTSGTGSPIAASDGSVAAWHALRFVTADASGDYAWIEADSDTPGGAATFSDFTPGGASASASSAADSTQTAADAGGGPSATSTPVTSASTSTAAQAAIGAGFQLPSVSGAPGGWVQLQSLISNTGFSDPGQAVAAVQSARAADPGNAWTRWVVTSGSDGQYYAYQGSIVSGQTPSLTANAEPAFVFGANFGEYFDGAQWQVAAS